MTMWIFCCGMTEFVYSYNKWHLHDIEGTCKTVTNSVPGLFKLVNIACLNSYCGFMEYNRLHIFKNEPQSMLGSITLVMSQQQWKLIQCNVAPLWLIFSFVTTVSMQIAVILFSDPSTHWLMQLLPFYALVKCWLQGFRLLRSGRIKPHLYTGY